MALLHALATLWPKIEHNRSKIYIKIFQPAVKGHTLVYVRQALLLPLFCFIMFSYARAQSAGEQSDAGLTDIRPLKVGDKLPETFWQQEYTIYSNGQTNKQTLEQYRDKLLILDFWAS